MEQDGEKGDNLGEDGVGPKPCRVMKADIKALCSPFPTLFFSELYCFPAKTFLGLALRLNYHDAASSSSHKNLAIL